MEKFLRGISEFYLEISTTNLQVTEVAERRFYDLSIGNSWIKASRRRRHRRSGRWRRVEMEIWKERCIDEKGMAEGAWGEGEQGYEGGWKTRCREGRRRGRGMTLPEVLRLRGFLAVGKRQKMKDIRDWPSRSAASLPGYGFILLFRFYSVRL